MDGMKIGIIGGSGLDDPKLLKDYKEIEVETPFGKPSSFITCGKIDEVDVFILARHGKKHDIPPSQVNYRANIYALRQLGCKHIIATSAVGSLREEIQRGDLVVLDDFIDFTRHRKTTFFEKFDFGPRHVSVVKPFSDVLREKIIESCRELDFKHHPTGTVITIEGPRFSSVAESKVFRSWNADVINMSIAPEAILAREAEVHYAAIAMATDYDCWKQDEEPVTWEQIVKIMEENSDKVKKVIMRTISKFSDESKFKERAEIIKSKIRTIPNWPKPGIMFRDITTLLKDAEGLKKVAEIFEERYRNKKIDVVAGIESRGFIVGSILAEKLNVGFVPLRKPGKLPAETISQSYVKEYGPDTIEIHKDAIKPGQKVLLTDDLIATGDTALAACGLIEKLGGEVVECAFIVDLPELKGKEKLNKPVFAILEFEGE